MAKFRFRKLLWLPAIIWGIAIIYLAVQPPPPQLPPFPLYDKLMHFGAFALLSVLLSIPRYKYKRWVVVIWIPAIYGAAIEILQAQMAFREGDFFDWLADALGSLTAYGFIILYQKLRDNRKP